MSLKPTTQVGSAAARASQSSTSSRSIAVSPPHGGNTARISASVSIPISSAARSSLVALMCDVAVDALADHDVVPLVPEGRQAGLEAGQQRAAPRRSTGR